MVILTFANLHGILALCCSVEKCEDNLLASADEKYRYFSIVDICFHESHWFSTLPKATQSPDFNFIISKILFIWTP